MTDAPEVRKRKSTRFLIIAAVAALVIALFTWWSSRDNDMNAGTSLGEAGDVSFDTGQQDDPQLTDGSGAATTGAAASNEPAAPEAAAAANSATLAVPADQLNSDTRASVRQGEAGQRGATNGVNTGQQQ